MLCGKCVHKLTSESKTNGSLSIVRIMGSPLITFRLRALFAHHRLRTVTGRPPPPPPPDSLLSSTSLSVSLPCSSLRLLLHHFPLPPKLREVFLPLIKSLFLLLQPFTPFSNVSFLNCPRPHFAPPSSNPQAINSKQFVPVVHFYIDPLRGFLSFWLEYARNTGPPHPFGVVGRLPESKHLILILF